MIKIIKGNSYSRITGLSPSQETTVRKALSYTIPHPYGKKFRSVTKYLINKRGEYPTGLEGRITEIFKDCVNFGPIENINLPPIKKPGMYKLYLPFVPYEVQLDAAKTASRSERGTISMPTGSGKAATIALTINELQVRTLVVVPNITLKRQLTESFKLWFGETAKNIVVENIDSKNLNSLRYFDCLICDESHHVAAATYRRLNKTAWNGIYYRLFFTATPFRSIEEEQILMESISGEVIYTLPYKTAIKENMIVPLEAYYIDLPKTSVKSRTWAAVYRELVTHNKYRNELITKLLLKFNINKVSSLCLVKEIQHGENISQNAIMFTSGEDKYVDKMLVDFSNGDLKTFIATTGVAGEGVDTRACEYVIVAGLGKSKNQFMQQIGRTLRKFPGKESGKVILFRDKSHKWTLAHFNSQVKFLKEELGIIPAKIEV